MTEQLNRCIATTSRSRSCSAPTVGSSKDLSDKLAESKGSDRPVSNPRKARYATTGGKLNVIPAMSGNGGRCPGN